MTSNQINYLGYAENVRHNKAGELLNKQSLAETRRHNVAYETETSRHNKISESQVWSQIRETYRHNEYSEYLTQRGQNISQDIAQLNYKASKYASDMSYANAVLQTQSAQKIANINAQVNTMNSIRSSNTALAAANINSNTALRTAKINAATSKSNAKLNATTNTKIANANRASNEYLTTNGQIVQLIGNLMPALKLVK